jgi:hypothetical protein
MRLVCIKYTSIQRNWLGLVILSLRITFKNFPTALLLHVTYIEEKMDTLTAFKMKIRCPECDAVQFDI